MDDNSLMSRVRKGDEHAFRVLVERYRKPVYNFFLRSLDSPEDCEDLAQQVFIKLYGASYEPREGSSFKSFLYRIATNLLIDHGRKDRTGLSVPFEDSGEGPEALVRPAAGPDDHAAAAQLRERYRAAHAKLPRDWRTVLDLRVEAGLSYREISESTGLSVPAVESILFRARERLAAELGEFRKTK
ncbi:MAG TPA: sigma-70 family RNA polymerase sigma factor [Candidatus Krumholzibacterium sp.]|nr:sigma-70 family RNA polymerase sigma factor [Candidatus Krumholzibacterium sp.]